MSVSAARVVLEARLKTWADAQVPTIPVAWQNVGFVKPTTTWLEPIVIPNLTIAKNLDTEQRELGLFQVNCWAPSGKGSGAVEQLAQAVAALYPILPKTGPLSIDGPAHVGRQIPGDSGWVIVPVLIPYRYEI